MSEQLSLENLLSSVEAEDAAQGSVGLNKEASDNSVSNEDGVAGELQTLLTKKASDNTGDTEMSEQTVAGTDLGQKILGMIKSAENKVISETSQMVSEDDQRDEATPRQGKTVTETAKALLDRGAQKGEVEEGRQEEAAAEGKAAGPIAPVASNLDKQAALQELVANGIDFEEAVELVKQASAEIDNGIEKVAHVANLMEEKGMDFEAAAALVKEASEAVAADEAAAEAPSELEKAAAVNELVGQGYDLADAVEAVNAAAAEL